MILASCKSKVCSNQRRFVAMDELEALRSRLRQLRSSSSALEKRQQHEVERVALAKAEAEAKLKELQELRERVARRMEVERRAREDIKRILPEAADAPYEQLPELVLWARRALELQRVAENLQKQRRTVRAARVVGCRCLSSEHAEFQSVSVRNRQPVELTESSNNGGAEAFLRRFQVRKELEIKHGFTAGA